MKNTGNTIELTYPTPASCTKKPTRHEMIKIMLITKPKIGLLCKTIKINE